MIQELGEHKNLLIALIVALIFGAIGIFVLSGAHLSSLYTAAPSQKDAAEPQSDQDAARGRLSLTSANKRYIFEQKELVALNVIGNSDGKDAVGFDAALTLDQSILTFSQAESAIDSFETFANANKDRVYVGGIKKLTTKNSLIFEDTVLTTISFKPAKQGHTRVDFLFKPQDTTESNIVLTTSKDGLGDVQGADIYVGTKVSTTPDESVILPGTNIKVQVADITTESATIDLHLGSQADTKKFTWGAGSTISSNIEKVFEYVFQVEKGQGDSVVIYYAVAE